MDMISTMFSWISSNLTILTALGAVSAFLWQIQRFLLERSKDSANREFDVFHRLVKEFVEPDAQTGSIYLDRQAAIAFELRHFKRYHEFSLRFLKSFIHRCEIDEPNLKRHAVLLEEMRQTVAFIEKRR